eukprot:CAMPEP_0181341310 /NCGR_PEP_ID=MMETSP1101-20121128/30338_1 /TAXON_ID=46948 /ORGANISM="Rhodomonas abbreviata, Strain Caron Lab Isolate" /LENGTH=89 /DNA_ID=CAMNT_0023452571 /DNA_START=31 /DNA_END=296 /DNA_ORIENTATION=-
MTVQTETERKEVEFSWARFGSKADLTAVEAAVADPETAERALDNPQDLQGKLAIVKRGVNPFFEKCERAADAGALGVVIVNTDEELIVP